MCGIAGFFASQALPPDAPATARAMGDALRHRGPDDSGEWIDAARGIALAHRRLAIVDLSAAGHQPMVSADGRWVLVFNGEVYNHPELRDALAAAGRAPPWRGHSDTETLLAAISAWGLGGTLQRVVGMFAFALWDRAQQTLTLARDRLGEKPLYYGVQRGVLLFGSEPKALRVHPAFDGAVDRGALALLLRYGYVPGPWSIHAGVRKLPPGTTLTLRTPTDAAGGSPQPYWSVSEVALRGAREPLDLADDEAVDRLDALLRRAVEGQRMADVPLGAFLSGGIDSSAVVAVAQALSGRPLRTFTIGFAEPGYDESAHARAVARHLGTQHTELVVTPAEARDLIPRLPSLYCEPLADPSQIPTYLVSGLARRHVTVSLSGDGGDELFGGYERYAWTRSLARVPLAARRAAGVVLGTLPAPAWSALLAPFSPILPSALREGRRSDRLRKLGEVLGVAADDELYDRTISFWPKHAGPAGADEPLTAFDPPLPALPEFDARMMLLDLRTYLPDDILVKVDRAAMAVSLETRVPLLDHRVVEFALRVPLHQKVRDGRGKWLLRKLLHRYVPPALVERPKMGFGIPVHDWLRGPLRDWSESLLDAGRLRAAGLIDSVPVRQLWAEHLAGHNDWGYRLWPVLMFEAWRDAAAATSSPAPAATAAFSPA
jgi:asparagine synthase (glutamine-hydrolysing)